MTLDLDKYRFDRHIIRLHKTGEYTRREIAKEVDISQSVVSRLLRKHGVLPRLHYRNELILRLHKEGVSLTDLVTRFGLQRHHIRDHILTGISFKAPLDPSALINTERVCAFCGGVYKSTFRDQILCSKRCVTDHKFVNKCAVYIQIREMRRTGSVWKDLAAKYAVTRQRIMVICSGDPDKNPWAGKLMAIEALRKHKDSTWLSGHAKFEKRKAVKALETAHMLKPLRRQGII